MGLSVLLLPHSFPNSTKVDFTLLKVKAVCVPVPVTVEANEQVKQGAVKGGLEGWGHHPLFLCSLTPLHSLRIHDPGNHHCQLHRAGPRAAPP